MSVRPAYYDDENYPRLSVLKQHWKTIAKGASFLSLKKMPIRCVGKTHLDVVEDVVTALSGCFLRIL